LSFVGEKEIMLVALEMFEWNVVFEFKTTNAYFRDTIIYIHIIMKLVKIVPSTNPKKKLEAHFLLDNGKSKIVRFGATGYEDFTMHKDEKRKELYLDRHREVEDWNNPLTAGALSRWILWNKPTIRGSVIDFKRKFGL